jgi:deferrochelatase/peroxidase EfeB
MAERSDAGEGPGVTRRHALRNGSWLVGAAAAGGALTEVAGRDGTPATASRARESEPFWGEHQAGITTDTQQHVVLAAFDIAGSDRGELTALLRAWTSLSAAVTAGRSVTVPIYSPANATNADAYAESTGASTTDDSLEAYGLGAQRLTVTIGFGCSLFVDSGGGDRFGIAAQLPPQLIALPHFSGDELQSAQSGGDLFVQACADDPQVAFHAVRLLARVAPDVATLRYTQLGFSPSNDGGTPRNLMGFKDGTLNSNVHPPAQLDRTVWAGDDGPAWMRGGSYLVYRRIRITLEHWDRLDPGLQEQVIGRRKLDGAPLGAANEFSPLDLNGTDSAHNPLIPDTAHVRLAAPQTNGGAVIMRRAFSYNNGTTPFVERWPPWRQALEYDAGLLFLGYQRDPRTAFIPIFARLAETDALNQFTTHTASACFAIAPGARRPGEWIGQTLLS